MTQSYDAQLNRYLTLLVQWNGTHNLIRYHNEAELKARHLADSMQLLDHLPGDGKTLIDLGSGGGLPGLVLAIMRPDMAVHLVESVKKKAAFLKHCALTLPCPNVTVHAARIEAAALPKADVITARALAALPLLLHYAAPLLKPGGQCLFLKGAQIDEEITAAQHAGWQADFQTTPSAVPAEDGRNGAILSVSNLLFTG